MNEPQFIKTPNGEELVVLSRADYEALVQAAADAEEDAADVAIYDARKADLVGSRALPAEVSRAMLGGASLLKALRLWRDVGQVKLASDIGVNSQGFISDLENGRRQMTDEVARRIAAALDVPESWLH
ncbi:MAG: helix-turn-helix transcriptional regulator [Devosia sp.]|nr:helix-turn-helix transcriptional regulator [Devosia sp.]